MHLSSLRLLGLGLVSLCALAADFVPVSGDWGTASNWNPAVVPTISDAVRIPPGSTVFLTNPGSTIYAATLTIDAGGTLDLTQGSNTDLSTLEVGGNLIVNGSLLLGGGTGGVAAQLSLNATAISLSGAGQVTIGAATGTTPSGINFQTDSTLTISSGATLNLGKSQLSQPDIADGTTFQPTEIIVSNGATVTVPDSAQITFVNGIRLENRGVVNLGWKSFLQFDGSRDGYVQTAGGVLNWKVNADGANSMMFPYQVSLNGTLNLIIPSGIFPQNGDVATLFTSVVQGMSTNFSTFLNTTDWTTNFSIVNMPNSYAFTYNLSNQSISWPTLTNLVVGGADINLPTTTIEGQTLSYQVIRQDLSASQSSIISGPKLRLSTTVGEEIKITATAPGNSTYAAFSTFTTTTVFQPQTVTVTATPASPYTYGDVLTLSATSTTSGAATWTSNSNVTFSGNVASLIGIGATTITATVPATGIYLQGSGSLNLGTIAARPVTVTVNGGTRAYNVGTNPTPTLSLTSGSFAPGDDLTTLSSAVFAGAGTTANASTAPGSYAITATLPGAPSTYAVTVLPGTLTITQAAQAITFGALAGIQIGNTTTLAATASSGLGVIYTSSDTAVATISGNQVTGVSAGTVTITASQPGNANYNAATAVMQSLAVGQLSQSVTFPAIAAMNVGQTATLTATASSTLAITYSSSDTAVATVSGSTITAVGAGTATITANQAGNANYSPAAATASVTVTKVAQTITFPAIAALKVGETGTLAATASSGLAVTYTSSDTNIAQISGTTVVAIGPGTVTITANQAGNATYAAATPATASLSVGKADQTITFTAPTTSIEVGASASLGATSSAGLAITYTSSAAAIARISGGTVVGVAPGTATITASQAGNANYNPATDVAVTVTVIAAPAGATTGTAEKTPEGGGCGAGSGIALLLGLGAWLGLGFRRRVECSARR